MGHRGSRHANSRSSKASRHAHINRSHFFTSPFKTFLFFKLRSLLFLSLEVSHQGKSPSRFHPFHPFLSPSPKNPRLPHHTTPSKTRHIAERCLLTRINSFFSIYRVISNIPSILFQYHPTPNLPTQSLFISWTELVRFNSTVAEPFFFS